MTTGVVDLFSNGGSVLNGTATFIYGLAVAFFQGLGLWVGFKLGGLWGPTYQLPDDLTCPDSTSDWWFFLWLPLQWTAWAILLSVPVRRWPLYWVAGLLMFAAWYGLSFTDVESDYQNLLGSFLVGVFGYTAEIYTGFPSVALFTFGFFLQVPGASTVVSVWAGLYRQTDGLPIHFTNVVIELAAGLYVAKGVVFAFAKPPVWMEKKAD